MDIQSLSLSVVGLAYDMTSEKECTGPMRCMHMWRHATF